VIRRAPSPPNPRPYSAQATASIIDFIDDASLLRASFDGPSWDRWRAVLRAGFALSMSRRDLELFAEVSGDRAPPRRRVRELICAVGRGGGKDSIAAALAVFIAVTSDFSRLRPGEKGVVMCLAVDRAQARIAFGYVRALLEETPLLRPLIRRVDADTIELKNGAEIIIQTNNVRSPRGRTICCVIFDECAFWLGEDFANPDVEVDSAVSPGLVRFPGSLKIIISSVHRRSGLLYDKVAKHHGHDDDDVLCVLGTSLQFNSTLDEVEIDRQLVLDPEKAGAEYMSQWRDDLTNFLDRQLVESAIDRGVVVRPPKHGITYVAVADPSGGRGDSFTAAVGHRERPNTLVVDALYERRAPFDSDTAIDDVAGLLRSYNVSAVRGDDYGADLTVAAFRRRGIVYRSLRLNDAEGRQGRLNRSEIYLNAVGLFTAGRVRLPDNSRLVHQLINLERRASRSSGHDTVDHPAGGHDDLANAACGCLVALAGKGTPFILSPAAIQRGASMPARNRFARSAGMTRFNPRQLGFR
jgi:hypothetical protein